MENVSSQIYRTKEHAMEKISKNVNYADNYVVFLTFTERIDTIRMKLIDKIFWNFIKAHEKHIEP